MTSFQQSRREGGFTLLELLLVIGVAALLLIGGIATYRLVSDGNKATEATRLLLTIRQEAQVIAQQSPDGFTSIAYATTTPAPNNIFVASGILRDGQLNPFGGAITVGVGATAASLLIQFDGVTRSSCVKMFTAITNPGEIIGVSVDGAAQVLADNGGTNDLTPANAAAACVNNVQTVEWEVK